MKKLISPKQLISLITVHTKEILRKPEILFWGIIFPLIVALGLGVAFNQSENTERNVAVIKAHSSSPSNLERSDLNTFLQNETEKIESKDNIIHYRFTIKDKKLGNTTYIFQRTNWDDAIILLKRGEINLIIKETDKGIEYHFDPINPDAQLTYLNLSKIIHNKKSPD